MLHARVHNILPAAAIAVSLASGLLSGCTPLFNRAESGPTPEKIDAVETREIAAPPDQVLRAAAAVLLDEGFVYCMSDHAAGLISGFRILNDSISSEYYARGGGMGTITGTSAQTCTHATGVYLSTTHSVIADSTEIWVRPAGPSRSLVRIQLWRGGARLISEPEVTGFASLIERRLLADSPAATRATAAAGARP
jgi:hypothetical protein